MLSDHSWAAQPLLSALSCRGADVQDADAGRGLEVAPYVTAVQEVAKCAGVATPTLDVVAALVRHYDCNLRAGVCGSV